MKIRQERPKPTPNSGFGGVSSTVRQFQVVEWDEAQGPCPYDGEAVDDKTPVSGWQDITDDKATAKKGDK